VSRLDEKGRLALPASLRRALAEAGFEALVLMFHAGSVWGWTPRDFASDIEDPLVARDPFDPRVVEFTHAILGTANDVEIDKQGRILIPPTLRSMAGLEREVMFNSLANRVEIWDKSRWDEHFAKCLHAAPTFTGMPRAS
jgi:MraZ protein